MRGISTGGPYRGSPLPQRFKSSDLLLLKMLMTAFALIVASIRSREGRGAHERTLDLP